MICLDFDGVIADSLCFWEAICRRAAAEHGMVLPDEARPFSRLSPLTFVQLALDLGLDPDEFNARMADLAEAQAQSIAPFPEMVPCLERLAALAPLVIISASQTAFIRGFLVRHGLDQFVSDVLGGDRHSGKAAALRGVPGAVVMIGDGKSDIDAAKEAGVSSIGVSWGWQDRSMIGHADSVADHPDDLVRLAEGRLGHTCGRV